MDNITEYVPTVQARDESSINLVDTTKCSKTTHAHMSEATKNNTDISGNYITVNHPRLQTKLKSEILRLSFLKRCKLLKRPPQSLRLKSSPMVPMKT